MLFSLLGRSIRWNLKITFKVEKSGCARYLRSSQKVVHLNQQIAKISTKKLISKKKYPPTNLIYKKSNKELESKQISPANRFFLKSINLLTKCKVLTKLSPDWENNLIHILWKRVSLLKLVLSQSFISQM